MQYSSPFLPFHSEHIGITKCLVLRNYAVSGQVYYKECVVEEIDDGRRLMRKLDIMVKQSVVNQLFDSVHDIQFHGRPRCRMAMDLFESDKFCLHVYSESDQLIMAMIWRYSSENRALIEFALEHIYLLGEIDRQPVDLCFDYLDILRDALIKDEKTNLDFEIDYRRGLLRFNIIRWIGIGLLNMHDSPPEVSGGRLSFRIEQNHLHLIYSNTASDCRDQQTSFQGRRVINCTKFYDSSDSDLSQPLIDIESDDISAFESEFSFKFEDLGISISDASFVEDSQISIDKERIKRFGSNIRLTDSLLSFDDNITNWRYQEPFCIENADSECPTIEAIHRAIYAHEPVSREAVRLALDEAKKQLPGVLLPDVLYMLYLHVPQIDDIIRLEILALAGNEDDYPMLFDILADIYKDECNYSMQLILYQKLIDINIMSPHRRIKYSMKYVDILAGKLGMYSGAAKKLESLKADVLNYGNVSEIIEFAQICHRTQYSGLAIQFLRSIMKNDLPDKDITSIGCTLAHIMLEHNEPLQSVITACSSVLSVDPQHIETLEILGQCLEKSSHRQDAADIYQQCLEFHMQAWELANFQAMSNPDEQNIRRVSTYAAKASNIALALESIYDELNNVPLRCLVLRQHLRLAPGSLRVLSRLLKDLEISRSFHEMVQVSLDFLEDCKDIDKSDEIAIRLTLYNIYDRELHLPDDASEQLDIARSLGPEDSRVILADIDRCRRAGLKDEEIGHRLALIEVLPMKECVEETLALVRQYEALNAPIGTITELLRRMNSRVPNHPLLLLELRQYLRKSGQSFELASVLEKLARVTPDLQTRKSILIEASEVHETLGNMQVARALYHEAQLCSPIDPSSAASFMNDKLRHHERSGMKAGMMSSLSSIVLTSRSLSLLVDVPSLASDEQAHGADNEENSQPSGDISGHTSSDGVIVSDLNELLQSKDMNVIDEKEPIEEQILDARLRGNAQALLSRLLYSIKDIAENEQPPRVLQEIGCIYLYERHDPETACRYLEHASAMSSDVAMGEQTLNALEVIYQSLGKYRELSDVYDKKIQILTMADEKRKYRIRLAQIRYEKLNETELAIDTLQNILKLTPYHENALQLLAQIYVDSQQNSKAIETLELMDTIIPDNSRQMAQHKLKLIALYIESGRLKEAKKGLWSLLESNDYVDKFAVIEHYKRICREHDEWEEQLNILKKELAIYLNISKDKCEINEILEYDDDILSCVAEHTLREYADVSYYKLQRLDEAAMIYEFLLKRKRDDMYPRKVLNEMREQHPDSEIVKDVISRIAKEDNSEK